MLRGNRPDNTSIGYLLLVMEWAACGWERDVYWGDRNRLRNDFIGRPHPVDNGVRNM